MFPAQAGSCCVCRPDALLGEQVAAAATQSRPQLPRMRCRVVFVYVLQRKPATELKGTTVITHHFEAALEVRGDAAEESGAVGACGRA